jgi:flagellar motor switch protein FliM
MAQEAMHDVPRSDALTVGQLRWLQSLHEDMPRAFAASLSAMLRSHVEIALAGADQLAYGKFVCGLEDPAYFSVLKADPLGDRMMLDVELAILYPILDRLLGGGHADEPSPRRPPSDIELPLAARFVRLFLKELQEAWQSVLPLQFETLQVGSHPRLLRVLPSDETVAVVRFAVTIGNRQGMMRLCLPGRAIRRIADKLADQTRDAASDAAEDAPSDNADDASRGAELVATLATTSIAASDLDGVRVGDIILTETAADTPAVVSIDGQPKFHAKPWASQGRKAVVLSSPHPDASS